jgi:hypothetical protein
MNSLGVVAVDDDSGNAEGHGDGRWLGRQLGPEGRIIAREGMYGDDEGDVALSQGCEVEGLIEGPVCGGPNSEVYSREPVESKAHGIEGTKGWRGIWWGHSIRLGAAVSVP